MSDASSELVLQLIAEIGEAGIAEMRRDPGLAAAVDQHTAAVRDVLQDIQASGDRVTDVLRDYVHGFADEAIERGWWPDGGFDWETVRVIAVCSLMREAGA